MRRARRLASRLALAAAIAAGACCCDDGPGPPPRDEPPDPSRVSVLARDLDQPVGLAADSGGALYVAERFGDRISRIAPSGVTALARGIARPIGLALGIGDTLFATTELGRLYTIAPGGDTSSVAVIESALAGVARWPSGAIFACDVFGGRVLEIARDGSSTVRAPDLSYPAGIEIESVTLDGSFFVSGALAGTVHRLFDHEPSREVYVSASEPPSAALDVRFHSDELFIADNVSGTIWKTPDGAMFERYIRNLVSPAAMAFSGDTLYVSSPDEDLVYRVLPPAEPQ